MQILKKILILVFSLVLLRLVVKRRQCIYCTIGCKIITMDTKTMGDTEVNTLKTQSDAANKSVN